MSTVLADLGGTRLKAATATTGAPRDVSVVEHAGAWLPTLREVLRGRAADELALCVPGVVDGGRVLSLPGKLDGIEGADLAELLEVRLPVLVNDALAYALGEATAGAGRGYARVVVVTLGTGVGVGVVEDGVPLGRGPLGGGVLGGQLRTGTGPGVDTLGRSGTFEAQCRAAALVAAVPGAHDVPSAYALAAAGGTAAVEGLATYRDGLAGGLVALCLAHAPDCVVVGGGAAQDGLLDGVQDAVQAQLWPGQAVAVRRGELGDAAALHGLAALLRCPVPG